jgi:hypothetical protein
MNASDIEQMLKSRLNGGGMDQGGPEKTMQLPGQEASPVMRDGDREFVMYETPEGQEIKIYGNWNEYAVSRDQEGRDVIADEDFPVVRNDQGEYVLDEQQLEHLSAQQSGHTKEQMLARETKGGQGASAIEDLMEKLNQYRR